MTGEPVVAWRCDRCTCLSVRRVTEPAPGGCDWCRGGLTPFPLRPHPLRRAEETR